jgi:hypothetical protein
MTVAGQQLERTRALAKEKSMQDEIAAEAQVSMNPETIGEICTRTMDKKFKVFKSEITALISNLLVENKNKKTKKSSDKTQNGRKPQSVRTKNKDKKAKGSRTEKNEQA